MTDEDYAKDAFRRYVGSNEDYIDTEHSQIMLTHLIKPTQNFTITTKAYKNDFARNWYKLDALRLGTSSVSINNILEDPIRFNAEYRAVTGVDNTVDNALLVKQTTENMKQKEYNPL